jgi:hypothetical protein
MRETRQSEDIRLRKNRILRSKTPKIITNIKSIKLIVNKKKRKNNILYKFRTTTFNPKNVDDTEDISDLTSRQFVNQFKKDDETKNKLFTILNKNYNQTKKIIENLEERMTIINEILLEYVHLTSIVMLDGHGRNVYMYKNLIHFGKFRKYKQLKKIKTHIPELDSITHKTHKLIYPKNVQHHKYNIIDYCNKYNDGTALFYYDFCNINNNHEMIEEHIKSEINKNHPFMISFSTRKSEKYKDLKNLLNENCDFINRGNFYTWFYKPE